MTWMWIRCCTLSRDSICPCQHGPGGEREQAVSLPVLFLLLPSGPGDVVGQLAAPPQIAQWQIVNALANCANAESLTRSIALFNSPVVPRSRIRAVTGSSRRP